MTGQLRKNVEFIKIAMCVLSYYLIGGFVRHQVIAFLGRLKLLYVLDVVLLLKLPNEDALFFGIARILLLGVIPKLFESLFV